MLSLDLQSIQTIQTDIRTAQKAMRVVGVVIKEGDEENII